MKVVFYASDKPRERMLAEALRSGVKNLGDDYEIRRTADYGDDRLYEGPSPDTDVACAFGVKGQTKLIMNDHLALRKGFLYFDKGYVRDKGEAGHTLYSRVAINDSDPTSYFQDVPHTDGRWRHLNKVLHERRSVDTGHVIFCGSSQKYCDFHGLGDANDYAGKLVKSILKIGGGRQVVYRPKPSFVGAAPIPGTLFSDGGTTFEDALRGAHCLVTHGSGAAAEAIIAGYPAIVLGNGIAKPVSMPTIGDVKKPAWARIGVRQQWASDLAHCQWTAEELRTGEAWEDIKETLVRLAEKENG